MCPKHTDASKSHKKGGVSRWHSSRGNGGSTRLEPMVWQVPNYIGAEWLPSSSDSVTWSSHRWTGALSLLMISAGFLGLTRPAGTWHNRSCSWPHLDALCVGTKQSYLKSTHGCASRSTHVDPWWTSPCTRRPPLALYSTRSSRATLSRQRRLNVRSGAWTGQQQHGLSAVPSFNPSGLGRLLQHHQGDLTHSFDPLPGFFSIYYIIPKHNPALMTQPQTGGELVMLVHTQWTGPTLGDG